MKFKLMKILVLIILFIQLFPYSTVLAAVTLEEAQRVVVSYAVNFQEKHGKEVSYYCPGEWHYRNDAYESNKKYTNPSNTQYKDKLLLDCVGWVNYCIHNATGLDCGASGGNSMCFAAPPGGGDTTYFSYHSGNGYAPGDILVSPTHVMVYTGDDEIVHSVSWDGLNKDALSKTHYANSINGYFRFNEKALEEMDKTNFNYGGSMVGESNSPLNFINNKKADFYYNGIPDGKYSVSKNFFDIIIDSIGDVFEYIVGILVMLIRMVFVGWTALIELLVNFTLESIMGESDLENIPVSSTEIDSGDGITLEKIIFDDIGIFDVNFFNFNDQNPEVMEKINK